MKIYLITYYCKDDDSIWKNKALVKAKKRISGVGEVQRKMDKRTGARQGRYTFVVDFRVFSRGSLLC